MRGLGANVRLGKRQELAELLANPKHINQARVSAWSLVLRYLVLLIALGALIRRWDPLDALAAFLLLGYVVALSAFSRELHALAIGSRVNASRGRRPRWLIVGVIDLCATSGLVALAGSDSPMPWLYFASVLAFSVYAIDSDTGEGVRKYVMTYTASCLLVLVSLAWLGSWRQEGASDLGVLATLCVALVLFAFVSGMLGVTMRSHQFIYELAEQGEETAHGSPAGREAMAAFRTHVEQCDTRLELAEHALDVLTRNQVLVEEVSRRASRLSVGARSVWELEATGLQRADIAERLHISPSTVDYHRGALNDQLGTNGVLDRRLYAVAIGIAGAHEFLIADVESDHRDAAGRNARLAPTPVPASQEH